jgi:hypothetical protein
MVAATLDDRAHRLGVWASIQLRVSSREIDFAGIVKAFWDQARAMLDSEEFPRSMHAASRGRVSD